MKRDCSHQGVDSDGPGILFWGGEAWCGVPPPFGNGHSETNLVV